MTSKPTKRERSPVEAPACRHILLLSSSPWLRIGFVIVFAPEFRIDVCPDADRRRITTAVASSQPDLIVLDLLVRSKTMLEVLKNFRAWNIQVPVLAFTAEKEAGHQQNVASAVHGVFSWCDSVDYVQRAVEKVGATYFPATRGPRASARRQMPRLHTGASLSPRTLLSPRELEVFNLIGQGATTRQIAHALQLSVSTIETYRDRMKQKLRVNNSAILLQRAIRWARFGI